MLAEILLKPSFLERLHHWLKTVAPTEDYKLCIVIRNALSSDSAYVLILKFSFWSLLFILVLQNHFVLWQRYSMWRSMGSIYIYMERNIGGKGHFFPINVYKIYQIRVISTILRNEGIKKQAEYDEIQCMYMHVVPQLSSWLPLWTQLVLYTYAYTCMWKRNRMFCWLNPG